MSRRLRQLLLTCLLLAFVLVLAVVSGNATRLLRAQTDPTVTPNINWVREPSGINVRSGPGVGYDVLGVLPVGTWVQPLGRTSEGEWILIAYLDTQGWVHIEGVTWRLNVASLPVIDDPEPTPIPPPQNYNTPGGPTYTPNANWVSVGAAGAFVRSGPGQGYPILGELYTGDVVDPVAHDRAENWVMIRFGAGYAWLRYDLAVWSEDVLALPVIDVPNLTPSFTAIPIEPSETPTHTATATVTPSATATATLTPSATATPTVTLTVTPSATPSVTATATSTATATMTATRTLTPTATATPTATSTVTSTSTSTATASATATPSATQTATSTPRATFTVTPSATPTVTATSTHTVTATASRTATTTPEPQALAAAHAGSLTATLAATSTPSATVMPSGTSTNTATHIPTTTHTATASVTASPTPTATATRVPSSTPTPTPTTTPSVTYTATRSPTETATSTATAAPTATSSATASAVPSATSSVTPSPTLSATSSPTRTPTMPATLTPTPLAIAAADEAGDEGDVAVPPPDDPPQGDSAIAQDGSVDDDGPPIGFLILGGMLALGVLSYLGIYVIQAANIARYREGFVLSTCPVCESGSLYVDDRRHRILGIPRVRRTVRCDNCRSVLRQVGAAQWRYAVDGAVNPELYAAVNGRVLSEDDLLDISPEFRDAPLAFIDEDDMRYHNT